MLDWLKAWNQERQRKRRLRTYYAVPGKTADRPHPVAVRLALLSPLLAVAAVGISYVSLETSRQSMEVGQRAYLSITDFTMRRDGDSIVLDCDIHNLGNTPARNVSVFYDILLPENIDATANFYSYPFNTSFPQQGFDGAIIGPKSLVHRNVRHNMALYLDKILIISAEASYRDVFGSRHLLSQCWQFNADLQMTDAPCETEERDEFVPHELRLTERIRKMYKR